MIDGVGGHTFKVLKLVSIVINLNGEYSKQSSVLVNGCRQLSGCSHRGGYSDASTRRRDGCMTQPATPGTDPGAGILLVASPQSDNVGLHITLPPNHHSITGITIHVI